MASLVWYSQAITGNWRVSPYQLYTDIYTPRHVFGFHNVERGARAQGDRELPKISRNYDAWAEDLTPRLAARNVWTRTIASAQWTLGIVPLAMALAVFVLYRGGDKPDTWLVPASIVSLHAVHVPYWYDGIMHWHYVFESAPLWLLLFGIATGRLVRGWEAAQRPWLPVWWGTVIGAACLTSHVGFAPFWGSRLEAAISEVRFARAQYGAFARMIDQQVIDRPALVLVEPDPADRHIDYVTNDPGLQNAVLFGRFDPETTDVGEVARSFPSRALYYYRVKDRLLTRLAAQ
jgi:hypothetical protein